MTFSSLNISVIASIRLIAPRQVLRRRYVSDFRRQERLSLACCHRNDAKSCRADPRNSAYLSIQRRTVNECFRPFILWHVLHFQARTREKLDFFLLNLSYYWSKTIDYNETKLIKRQQYYRLIYLEMVTITHPTTTDQTKKTKKKLAGSLWLNGLNNAFNMHFNTDHNEYLYTHKK